MTRRTSPHLNRLGQLVERGLTDALKAVDESLGILHDAIQYCVFSGGKRFRPLLCLAACEAAGETTRRALPAACAIELIHTYSLVHDDLPAMDNADERRGQPSCHKKFGEAAAILTGDALLTLAFEHVGALRLANAHRILTTLAQAGGTLGLIGGQMLDLQETTTPGPRGEAWEERLTNIAQRKTGALIEASAVIGGLSAAAPEHVIGQLRQYGQRVGLAFQLIDDLHDGDGLTPVLGAAQLRRRASELLREAADLLAPMGRRAEGLREIVAWLTEHAKEHTTHGSA